MSFDFGERRIGVAVTDPTRTIASPLTTLTRRAGKRPPWTELERLVHQYEIEEVVVGLPLSLAGEDTPWTAEVREFAAKVGARTGLPVHLIDERLTSVRAERAVRGIGLKKSQREEKGRVDSAAAALILQNYLEFQRGGA